MDLKQLFSKDLGEWSVDRTQTEEIEIIAFQRKIDSVNFSERPIL